MKGYMYSADALIFNDDDSVACYLPFFLIMKNIMIKAYAIKDYNVHMEIP